MNVQEDELIAFLASFVWPFMRLSAMFISVPVLSNSNIPARLRVVLSMLITFTLWPALPSMPEIALFSAEGLLVTVQQLVIGVSAGFILQMVFSIMLVAGQSIAYGMGLGFASMVDPATGVQTPVIAQLFVISSSLLFLGVDGHLLLIEMLAQSFKTLPVQAVGFERGDVWRIVAFSSQIVTGGVLLALPIIATLLFVNVSFGVASKAAPQLQLFGVGFPITILLGMVLIGIGLSSVLDVFAGMLHDSFRFISELLRIN